MIAPFTGNMRREISEDVPLFASLQVARLFLEYDLAVQLLRHGIGQPAAHGFGAASNALSDPSLRPP